MASASVEKKMTASELRAWLVSGGVAEDTADMFESNEIDGEGFFELSESDLKELAPIIGTRLKLRALLKKAKEDERDSSSSNVQGGEVSHSHNHVVPRRQPLQEKDINKPTIEPADQVLPVSSQSNWHLTFRIPERSVFSESVRHAIDTGVVTAKCRTQIILTLRTLILQHTQQCSKEQYRIVSQMLIEKYPKLRDPVGTNGFGSWKMSLRNSFKNWRKGDKTDAERNTTPKTKSSSSTNLEPPSKRTKVAEEEVGEDFEKNVTDLAAEWQKGKKKRSQAVIKSLMSATASGRRQWIIQDRPLIQSILLKYPCFSSARMVRHDFRSLLELEGSVNSLKEEWALIKEKVVKLAKLEASSRPTIKKLLQELDTDTETALTDDHSNYVVLNIVMRLLYPRGPAKDSIIIRNFETTDVDVAGQVSAISQAAPYIVVVGKPGAEEAQYFICGEGGVVLESKSLLDAMVDLIATYYVFDIAYTKPLAGICLFLQHYVFNIKDTQPIPPCLLKLIKNFDSI